MHSPFQTQMIEKYGYPQEKHHVVTDDGYILEMHRIARGDGPPVFLMHGLLDSSATWVMSGPRSALGVCSSGESFTVIHALTPTRRLPLVRHGLRRVDGERSRNDLLENACPSRGQLDVQARAESVLEF